MDPNQSKNKIPGGNNNFVGNHSLYQGQWFPYQGAPNPWFNAGGFMHPPSNAPAMYPAPQTSSGMPPVYNLGEQADPSVADVEEDEDITPSKKKNGSRVKLANFLPEEDICIVKSWIEISCDSVTNTGQKKDKFWKRIVERYHQTKGHYPDRSLRSVQTRWEKIKQESGKFAGYVADALRANASGKSDADKTSEAAATFAAVEGHNFHFLYCWDLLKDEPKWQDLNQRDEDGFGDHIPPGSNTINIDDNDPSPDTSRKRPIGREAAKASRKKNNSSGSTSSSEYASRMQEMSLQKISIWQDENTKKGDRFDQLTTIEEKRYDEQREHNKSILQLEQEKLKIMRDKLDMQMREKEREREEREKAEDERILKINLDACTPDLRMYYQALREDILEKVAARRRRD